MAVEIYRQRVNEMLVRARTAKQAYQNEWDRQTAAEDHLTYCQEAQKALQMVAQAVQQQAHDRIAGVVSRCLEAVFPEDPYEFKIIFEQKRGRTEARLIFLRADKEVDPLGASGGGAVDVAAFALRVSCIMLSQPPVRKVLFMDEGFRFVSVRYRERVRKMLIALSKDLGMQFVMTTHMPEFSTPDVGTIIEL